MNLRRRSLHLAVLAGSIAFAAASVGLAADYGGADLTRLPLGNQAYSLTEAAVGSVFACQAGDPNAGGASAVGEWVDESAGTYDLTGKVVVDGSNLFDGSRSFVVDGDVRVLTTNALPDHGVGTYPISRTDDAYQYDRNPHEVTAQDYQFEVPANPTANAEPSCLGFGAIGILDSGVPIFNAFDGRGDDAVANEIQDACDGHPESSGQYHYHSLSRCLEDLSPGTHSERLGYALDGFGFHGRYGEGGVALTNDDLDECHGHTHDIEWDGATAEMYHYHATWEFPYSLGCFRGTSAGTTSHGGVGGDTGGDTGGGDPDASADGSPTARDIATTCDSRQGATYDDVPAGSTHEYSISCITGFEVSQGYGDGRYGPGASLSRGQTATFLLRALQAGGATVPASSQDAFDDDDGTAHEDSLNRLAGIGVIDQPADRRSRAGEPITRAEMARWTARSLEYAGLTLDSSTDWYGDDDGHVDESHINAITAKGIVTGRSDGTYGPDAQLSRAQMATFVARTIDALLDGDAAPAASEPPPGPGGGPEGGGGDGPPPPPPPG